MTVVQSFPQHYSIEDQARALALIEASLKEVRTYDDSWKADWLVNGCFENEWQFTTRRSSVVDGVWTNTKMYSWDFLLANGTSLTAPVNRRMLISAQKIAFLARTLPSGGIRSSTTLHGFLYSQRTLIRWLYLHEEIYQPANEAFQRLSSAAISEFLYLSTQGGVPWILGYPIAFLKYCTQGAQCTLDVVRQDSLLVPDTERKRIIEWLQSQGFYRPSTFDSNDLSIDRRRIAVNLGFDLHTIKSHARFSAFLRQFEPSRNSLILVGRERRREYSSHRTRTVQSLVTTPQSGDPHMAGMLSTILRLHRHLPGDIPDSAGIEWARILRRHLKKGTSHTPWIPLNTALKYTTESLRWVHVYGEDLVTYFLMVAEVLQHRGLLDSTDNLVRREIVARSVAIPDSLRELNISGWTPRLSRDVTNYDEFRASPSVGDALSVLVGAIIQVVGCLKPSRESEIRDLKRDCVLKCM